MTQKFDLIVIGTGTAGSIIAKKCRSAGWSVAILDSRPFGGTCALRGCDAKKVLGGAAEVIDWAKRMQGKGITSADLQINWQDLMQFKRTFTGPVPQKREKTYTDAGIKTFHGLAKFVDETTVQVGDERLSGRYVAIAAGAEPAPLGISGEEYLTYSDQFLELETLPRQVAMIGGGYISMEFAHVAARAGAQVRILHQGSRPLEPFDPDLVERLVEATQNLGINLQVNTQVKGIQKQADRLVVQVETEQGEETFDTEMVVHGAGRVPTTQDLDLEKAGIKYEKKGISVNDYLQSISNPQVYAAGDISASGAPPLTPVSSIEGHVVADNLLQGNHHKPDFTEIPSMVFSIPTLASVGLQEKAAREQGLKFKTLYEPDTSDWYFSRRINEPYSGFKVLVEEGSDRILGAHLLGSYAEELVNIFALAIRYKLSAEDLKRTTFAFPTAASNLIDIV
ncbi:NAD(P)/FAD-dependent oxidoreductase [Leptolyngbya sp. FACHB-541]|uniref:dihydrolipoyl dehydrogenase family protein n=1 Tax=Leptolyngbya sp. FACHB-541 TaxID=2692810 RepID=UPI00168847A5|nr:NAD(P)/FAD-dependent oxidoreductase [Leptolyngbya sp. FACHB-541]MBD1998506.1 NAD(P)/FAD-dependent oxidoreductase [Leptolyngbya sp. FACHB-541]